jgi:hypothetical protein
VEDEIEEAVLFVNSRAANLKRWIGIETGGRRLA